jgi:hypothetical protein
MQLLELTQTFKMPQTLVGHPDPPT